MRALHAGAPLAQHLACLCSTATRTWSSSASSQTTLIKSLRERSGAPISDVKACLVASGWDLDKAYDALRLKGLAAAAKKASRHASEGLVGLAATQPSSPNEGPCIAIVEVNSETDFASRSDVFRSLVSQAAAAALGLQHGAASATGVTHALGEAELQAAPLHGGGGRSAGDAAADVAAQVRENVRLRRGYLLQGPPGSIAATYLHQSPAPGLGTIAAAVLLQPEGGGGGGGGGPSATSSSAAQLPPAAAAAASELAAGIAMHAAGMRPLYLARQDVPPEALDRERRILSDQASGSSKPAAVVAKMVEGRLSKFYEDTCLLEQRYLLDDSVKVGAAVERLGKQVGVRLRVAAFLRVQCGEGLDTGERADFAAEVAKMANN